MSQRSTTSNHTFVKVPFYNEYLKLDSHWSFRLPEFDESVDTLADGRVEMVHALKVDGWKEMIIAEIR